MSDVLANSIESYGTILEDARTEVFGAIVRAEIPDMELIDGIISAAIAYGRVRGMKEIFDTIADGVEAEPESNVVQVWEPHKRVRALIELTDDLGYDQYRLTLTEISEDTGLERTCGIIHFDTIDECFKSATAWAGDDALIWDQTKTPPEVHGRA